MFTKSPSHIHYNLADLLLARSWAATIQSLDYNFTLRVHLVGIQIFVEMFRIQILGKCFGWWIRLTLWDCLDVSLDSTHFFL
jgi:hypothetical protein